MHIFDDDSFVIDAFYQNSENNLDLYLDTDANGTNFLGIYNFVSFPDCAYYLVKTGRESMPEITMTPGLDDSGEYGSTFERNGEHGKLTIMAKYNSNSKADTFEW